MRLKIWPSKQIGIATPPSAGHPSRYELDAFLKKPGYGWIMRRRLRRQSLRRAEGALPARGVEGQMKRPDGFHRQDPIDHSGIVFGDRPHLRLVFRIVQDQSA